MKLMTEKTAGTGTPSPVAALLALALPLVFACCGDGVKAADNASPSLEALDLIVRSTAKYDARKLGEIEECRRRLEAAPAERKAGLCNEMFELYYAFHSDSALFYAHRAMDLSRETDKLGEECTAKLYLAQIYQVTGSCIESLAVLDSLDRRLLDKEQSAEMFSLYNTNYEALKSMANDRGLKKKWQDRALVYKDSLLAVDSNIFVICDKLKLEGRCGEALALIKPYCDSLDTDDPLIGAAAYVTADLYQRMGMEDEEIDYLVRSARSDLLRSNKEYISLINLAILLYEKKDITRAYNYLNRSIEDATFCKARLRIDQIAPMVSIINASYQEQNNRLLRIISAIAGLLLLMAGALLVLMRYLSRQRQHLAEVNRELERSKDVLEEANREIREASNIKNAYITRLMLDCISRIENFDTYRKGLRKKILSAEYDSLRRELKSNEITEAEWKSFYQMFDTTFLSLFPDFVEELNRLLLPEHRLNSVPEKKALLPEVRIYALIRLGINSSEQIATLLRYSRSTIYSYRSRTRLKAVNPAGFEAQIMGISSI